MREVPLNIYIVTSSWQIQFFAYRFCAYAMLRMHHETFSLLGI